MPRKRSENGQKARSENVGKVIEIKGVVIDAVFPGALPEINNALQISIPEGQGREAGHLIAEVQQHLGDDRVRAVAMDSTDGLARGLDVSDTGGPISVPVGDQVKGHVFNALGECIDKPDLEITGEMWCIHR